MGTNRFYLLDSLSDEPIPWKLEDEPPLPWPDCRYFAQVLSAVDRARPDLNLRFVVTDRVMEAFPLRGEDVVVICIHDELSRMPGYVLDVRLLAKTYGVRRTANALNHRSLTALVATLLQEAFVQGRRAPSLLASGLRAMWRAQWPRVLDVPLGTYLLEEVPLIPFDDRSYDISYGGSRVNSSKEADRRIPSQKMRSRRELETVLESLAMSRPDLRLGVQIIEAFHDAPAHGSTYSRLLVDSRMALCPRGGSLETYRFFEALRCGAVPVTERLPPRDFYTNAPVVRVDNWAQLPTVLDRLLSDPDRLRSMHEAVLSWWSERCSPAAVASRLLAALETQSSTVSCTHGA